MPSLTTRVLCEGIGGIGYFRATGLVVLRLAIIVCRMLLRQPALGPAAAQVIAGSAVTEALLKR